MIKVGTALAATLFAVTSLSVLAQQPAAPGQPGSAQTQQTNPAPQTTPSQQTTPAQQAPAEQAPAAAPAQAAPANTSPVPALSPVDGKLVSKLDSKTAKAGDNVVIETRSAVKTADGTEIPKGSRLTGHVVGAQPSSAGANGNSQVAVELDSIEIKGGQKLAVRSQIESLGTVPDAGVPPTSAPAAASPSGAPATGAGGLNSAGANSQRAGSAPQAGATDASSASGAPTAGTVVARNGKIAISTTSIPGVLLANNAPGEQDPRMAKASTILLGAKKDVQLEDGTQVVIGVAAAGAGQ